MIDGLSWVLKKLFAWLILGADINWLNCIRIRCIYMYNPYYVILYSTIKHQCVCMGIIISVILDEFVEKS